MVNIYECPYCGNDLKFITGSELARKQRALKFFTVSLNYWFCNNDHELAFVGAHRQSNMPMGFAAGYNLRQLRTDAHRALDCLWKGQAKHMTRTQAYAWLADQLNITSKECHIGLFDEIKCQLVVDKVSDYWFNKETL